MKVIVKPVIQYFYQNNESLEAMNLLGHNSTIKTNHDNLFHLNSEY